MHKVHIQSQWDCAMCRKRFELRESDKVISEDDKQEMLLNYLSCCKTRSQQHQCSSSEIGVASFVGVFAAYQLPEGFTERKTK